jgi:hypothetical protein
MPLSSGISGIQLKRNMGLRKSVSYCQPPLVLAQIKPGLEASCCARPAVAMAVLAIDMRCLLQVIAMMAS